METKAKILAILLVICLLAAVYAPAVSASRDSGNAMWRLIWGGEGHRLAATPTVAVDENKVDVGKNVTKVTPACPKQEHKKRTPDILNRHGEKVSSK